jgi:signal transduction histidine kinase
MSLKSKSILIIALLFWLKIVLIYLIFAQLNNSNKLTTYIGDHNQNHTVSTDLTLLKGNIKTSQIVFSQYLGSQEVKHLKNYSSIITTVASDLSQIHHKYKNSILYEEILENELLINKGAALKTKTDSLLLSFDENPGELQQSSGIQSSSVEDINITEEKLISKNQKIATLLTDLLNHLESVVSKFTIRTNQKLLDQQIKDTKTRNVFICFVVFLMLLLLLLLFTYLYEIFRLEKKLKEANDQIQEDLMLKNKIISLLTHEIRTPVNVIRMSSYLVSEKTQDPEVKEIFNSIKYTSDALTLIANQALEVVKLGNHEELIFDIAELDIDFEIREIIKSLQVIAHSINIDLILHMNTDQPFMINYDKVRLYELLCNVIGNALKFANTKIDICVKKNNQTIFFEILDDGCGVEEEDLNHIFDLNYQGKKARRTDTLSMGLGLYLCRRIIEKSNGTIIVNNSGSSGLKVVFSIDSTVFLNTMKTK